MPRNNRNRNRTTPTPPIVRQVGDWLDVGAHEAHDEANDDDKVYRPEMFRISEVKRVAVVGPEEFFEDEPEFLETHVWLRGHDEPLQFGFAAFEPIRRRLLGARDPVTETEPTPEQPSAN